MGSANSGPQLAVLKLGTVDHLPQGETGPISVASEDPAWKLVDRARNWKLVDLKTKTVHSVRVHSVAGKNSLDVDLSGTKVVVFSYRRLDWDKMTVTGVVYVVPLDSLTKARICPESQDQVREEKGRTVVEAEGADFEFLEKVAVQKTGDQFHPPAPVPFSLPQGAGRGPQAKVSFRVWIRSR